MTKFPLVKGFCIVLFLYTITNFHLFATKKSRSSDRLRCTPLDENVLENKQNRNDDHGNRNLFLFASQEIDQRVRNKTDADAFRDAVGQRHEGQAKESRDAFCRIEEIDLYDILNH